MADSPDAPPTIRCLHCDYDLRGLTGDPLRCPECGQHTSYAHYAAWEARRLRRTTKPGDHSIQLAIVMPVFVFMLVTSRFALLCAACGALPFGIWLVSLLVSIWRETGGTPGWVWVLTRHQLSIALIVLAILGWAPVFVTIAFGVMILDDRFKIVEPWRTVAGIGIPVVFVAMLIIALFCAERAGQWATSTYDQLNHCRPLRRP